MGTINEKELDSMLYLLDDSDERVVEHIEEKVLNLGNDVLPHLESRWPTEENVKRQERMLTLIKSIKQQALASELKTWRATEGQDLLEGMLILNKLKFPEETRQNIDNVLDKIKLDAWLELNYDLTSFEKIKIFNHVFFDVHQFQGDSENYHQSDNSFISSVLDRKKGNPISLAVIYSIITQRLNIPVYGVNLPQHFILGYVKDFDWPPLLRFNDPAEKGDSFGNDMLFYINPFNKGLIFNNDHIHTFLKQLKLEPKEDYFKACSNSDIILRVLRNLEVSYAKENNNAKLEQVKMMIGVLLEED
jgi:regulator of sirC expression with transglutaminase-like and TPR domain